jgi:hypothetical protein
MLHHPLLNGRDYDHGSSEASNPMIRSRNHMVFALAAIILLVCCSDAVADKGQGAADVKLLKFPYPYRCAVTIASDTHQTSVLCFEALHRLIDTDYRIESGSAEWGLLFSDPAIGQREEWRNGVDGFELPISDTFWLYDPVIGVYDRFDTKLQKAIPHAFEGEDFREIISRWIQLGWVDVLHTGGQGEVPREAMIQGLKWLETQPPRARTVWINHSVSETPCCVEPDVIRALPFTVKNIARYGIKALQATGLDKPLSSAISRLGKGALASKIVDTSYSLHYPFPAEQRIECGTLAVVLFGSLALMLVALLFRRMRKWRVFLISGAVFLAAALILFFVPIRYAQGDNKGSPYYCLDLVKEAGFKFFWFTRNVDGYKSLSSNLALPEISWGERSSYLHKVTMDDGNQVLAFPRSYKGHGGRRSLELLTAEALDNLCDRQGTAILYTHWGSDPQTVLTAQGLTGLENLKRYYEDGRVWVAPTSRVLQFEYAKTFLRYSVRSDGAKRIIDIERIDDPVGNVPLPSLGDLQGLSFECPPGCTVEVQLEGHTVPTDSIDVIDTGSSVIARFPVADVSPGS